MFLLEVLLDDVVGVRPVPCTVDLLAMRREVGDEVVPRGFLLLLGDVVLVAFRCPMRIPRSTSRLHDVQEGRFQLILGELAVQACRTAARWAAELALGEACGAVAEGWAREVEEIDHTVGQSTARVVGEGINERCRRPHVCPVVPPIAGRRHCDDFGCTNLILS